MLPLRKHLVVEVFAQELADSLDQAGLGGRGRLGLECLFTGETASVAESLERRETLATVGAARNRLKPAAALLAEILVLEPDITVFRADLHDRYPPIGVGTGERMMAATMITAIDPLTTPHRMARRAWPGSIR